jgi:hypothetical protein
LRKALKDREGQGSKMLVKSISEVKEAV